MSYSYYRSDGKCNSQSHPGIGARNTALLRLFEDGYKNGLNHDKHEPERRTARDDAVFANDRKGKNTNEFPETNNDEASMVAQLLTHEMVKTKKAQVSENATGGGFQCCNPQNDPFIDDLIEMNEYCHPIKVKPTDKCFGNVGCLNFIQPLNSMRPGCPLDVPPTPINFETPYLDAQLIYGDASLDHLDANSCRFDLSDFSTIKDLIVGYDDRSQQLPPLFQFLHFFFIAHNRIIDRFEDIHGNNIDIDDLCFETQKLVTALYQKVYLDLVKNVLREFIELCIM